MKFKSKHKTHVSHALESKFLQMLGMYSVMELTQTFMYYF